MLVLLLNLTVKQNIAEFLPRERPVWQICRYTLILILKNLLIPLKKRKGVSYLLIIMPQGETIKLLDLVNTQAVMHLMKMSLAQ
ncbi:hypothetical protein MHP7448_0691 [Mesomycoplasma hyopneumoniae 7448]|uniref:Uncharacterized protein n=1 Tax=Mesomycoplasma hyopneumoniae (strain 7448) TaxID=262722 RepID=A4Q7V8_MESH7|nr:hypothetical protein MHP7448_0691 [Mesomycoplasma hyopneumoniae 7448]